MMQIQVTGRLARLFCCLMLLLVAIVLPLRAADPAKTIVADTLYRADGATAKGTLLISWPAFSTADGKPVAAGTLSAKIGANGGVNIPLIPTQGATPSGTAYRVVISLDDGSSSTEYWAVPTLSPTTIAAIRSTQVPATVAMQVVSRDYVDTQLATAVRKNGDETITGTKTFDSSPAVPSPSTEAAAANKSYVDTAIAAAAPSASNVLNVNKGGTGTGYFTPARCVRVAADGGSLESAPVDCGSDSDTLDGLHAADFPDSQQYNPHTYGALCNGSHDDTAAYEQMFAAIAAGRRSGRVAVPPGGCVITRTINLAHMPPLIIEGVGGQVTATSGAPTSPPTGSYFINSGIASDGPIFWVDGAGSQGQLLTGFVTFRDLGFTSATPGNGSAIKWDDYGGQNSMENVDVDSFKYGITFGTTYQLYIADSRFNANTKAIYSQHGVAATAWPHLSHVTLRGNTQDIDLESGTDNLTIDGKSVIEASQQTNIYVRTSGSVVIRDSHFECGPQTSGYRVDIADNGVVPASLFLFQGNDIANGCGKPGGNVGILLTQTVAGGGISSMVIQANKDATPSTGGYVPLSVGAMNAGRNLTLIGNTFNAGAPTIDASFNGQLVQFGNSFSGTGTATASGAGSYVGGPVGASYPWDAGLDVEPKLKTGGILSSGSSFAISGATNSFTITDTNDATATLDLKAGTANDQIKAIRLLDKSATPKASFQVLADGTGQISDGSAARFQFATNGGSDTTNIIVQGNNAATLARTGTGLYIQNAGGTTYYGQILSNGQYVARPNAASVSPFAVQGISTQLFVTSDFTTAGNTNLQTITGLSWTVPANLAMAIPLQCHILYSQATAAVSDSFGFQSSTVAPTNWMLEGYMRTSATASTNGNLSGAGSTTAAAIVSATPGASGTVYSADIYGMIEQPSNASATTHSIMVKTGNAADLITIKRGSFCRLW